MISFLKDLILSVFSNKDCLKIEDFDDFEEEIQTLRMLAGKQILFDFTKISQAQNCNSTLIFKFLNHLL